MIETTALNTFIYLGNINNNFKDFGGSLVDYEVASG